MSFNLFFFKDISLTNKYSHVKRNNSKIHWKNYYLSLIKALLMSIIYRFTDISHRMSLNILLQSPMGETYTKTVFLRFKNIFEIV